MTEISQEVIQQGPDVIFDPQSSNLAEGSIREIAEIDVVLPPEFRGRALLDIGGDAGVVTHTVGRKIGSQIVHVVEPSGQTSTDMRDRLLDFPTHVVHSTNFSDLPHQGIVFDLAMLDGILARAKDPVGLLRKASEISRFAVIRSPLEDNATALPEESDAAHGEKRDERVGYFAGRSAVRATIEAGGFDILADPASPGESYVALLKSRNVEVMDPETANKVHGVLVNEFGEDNLVSVGIFGSTTRATDKANSDYDYTLIVKDLSPDVYEREKASPRIKKRLREAGVDELCAFNLYTPEEFEGAHNQKFWLVESMKAGYRVVHDTDGFLSNILGAKQPNVERMGTRFAWRGVEYVEESRFEHVIASHERAATLLADFDVQLADCHRREAQRVGLIAKLYTHGEAASRGSLFPLAQRLNSQYGEGLDLAAYQQADFDQETEGKSASYGYDTVDRHLKAAEILGANGMPLEALSHTATAVRNVYLNTLHSHDNYIVDGEITQLFLREFSKHLPAELVAKIYASSFKAEQILGRSGFLSFDLDRNGKPVYEDPQTSSFDYAKLTASVREIIDDLRGTQGVKQIPAPSAKTLVSIVIPVGNNPAQLEECISSLDRLIIPEGKAELVVVNDGSSNTYDADKLRHVSKLPLRFVENEHGYVSDSRNVGVEASTGEYITFINDEMTATPLWLVNLLSGFKDGHTAGVGATNLAHPRTAYVAESTDHSSLVRQPSKDITRQVLNIFTGSASVRRNVLQALGGFKFSQSASGIEDGLDLARRIRGAGYSLGHVEGEPTFS